MTCYGVATHRRGQCTWLSMESVTFLRGRYGKGAQIARRVTRYDIT